MGRKRLDIIGETFSHLHVLGFDGMRGKHSYWLCACLLCGDEKVIKGSKIKSGEIQSCGCLNYKSKHGHASRSFKNRSTPTYNVWLSMRGRCLNNKNKHYSSYGGRGITICKRWGKFENFLEDMGERPKGRSLDRVNNDGNYTPSNCRWATPKQQTVNRRGKKDSSSKYKGVVKFSPTRWRARIRNNNILIDLGLFSDEKDAARAYNKKASELWGDDAYLNVIS